MDHWRSVLPAGAMLDVAYEDVVDDLEQQARRLIDYCGLAWDDRCLSFHETSRPVATASNVQVRQPLYRSSVARWRRYEAYLEPLLAELESCRQPIGSADLERTIPMTTSSQPPESKPNWMRWLPWRSEHIARGDWPRPPTAYRQILALRPDIAEAYNNLGNVLLGQGKLDEAAAQYERSDGSQARPVSGPQ